MVIRKLRLQRGWSQEQLAEMCDISVRTVQRLERGDTASTETLKAIAAVFDVHFSELQGEPPVMNDDTSISYEEKEAIEYVRDLKGFYSHAASYVLVMTFLLFVNLTTTDYLWVIWPAMGWGLGLASHALQVFEVFDFWGDDWEKREVEKRLGRKL